MIKRIKRKYTLIVMSSVILVLGLIITAINIANYSSINSLLDEKLGMLVDNEGLMPDLPFGEKPEDDEDSKDTDDSSNVADDGEDNTDGDGGNQTGDGDLDESNGDENGSGDEDLGGDNSQNDQESGDGAEEPGEGEDPTDDENTPTDDKNDKQDEEEEEDKFYQHMSPETPFELRYFSVKLNTDGGVIAVDTSKIAAVDPSKAEKYAKQIFSENKDKGFLDSYKYMVGATEDGNFEVAFAIAAILMILTLLINLSATLIGKYFERKSKV